MKGGEERAEEGGGVHQGLSQGCLEGGSEGVFAGRRFEGVLTEVFWRGVWFEGGVQCGSTGSFTVGLKVVPRMFFRKC